MDEIEWNKQHCGVHQATFEQLVELMPDLACIEDTFPEDVNDFTWDVKVHMLMPEQFPCIPNWHYDNVPRVNGKQDFSKCDYTKPMYLWLSGEPLTEFDVLDGDSFKIKPQTWVKFNQGDMHRGTASKEFTWRGFIRASHRDILPANKNGLNPLRRHSQVYLDSNNFTW